MNIPDDQTFSHVISGFKFHGPAKAPFKDCLAGNECLSGRGDYLARWKDALLFPTAFTDLFPGAFLVKSVTVVKKGYCRKKVTVP